MNEPEGSALTAPEDPRWLDDAEMEAWLGLVQVVYRLPQALDRQLRQEVGISHSYYSMLATLSTSPNRTLSMGELARFTDTSPSRLSHAVSTLESRGWVTRRPSAASKRVLEATLTDEGFEVLRRVAPSHVAEVRRRVFDRLTPAQVEQLRDLTATLAEGLDGGPEQPTPANQPL